MLSTVVVIPCYNEEQRLRREAFLDFAAACPDVRLLFVNDGSTDRTLDVLQELVDEAPYQLDVCDLPQNGGKAEAVRQGMLAALSTSAECVGFLDADLATPLDAIPLFADVLRRRHEIEVVIGSRACLLGRRIQRNPKRRLLGRLFATVASQVLWTPIMDTQCGAKLFRGSDQLRLALSQPFLARWIFDVELLARMKQLRHLKNQSPLADIVFEQPLDEWFEIPGSKLKATDFLKAPWELVQIYQRYLAPWAAAPETTTVPLPVMQPFQAPERFKLPMRRSA